MPRQIAGFLIDIDGVLVTDNQQIPGAVDTLQFLKEQNIPFLLTTNTTRQSRITIWHHLKRLGFPIKESDIFSAPIAAVNWLKKKKVRDLSLLLSGSAVNDFKEFKITAHHPRYLIIGDIGHDLTFEKLNSAFRLVMGGAKLLALQKNRYWHTSEGLTIDAGALVAALEYATQKRATILGKPSKDFFLEAARQIKLHPEELAIVGDDLESDIKGGQRVGMFTILVKTGKFREEIFNKSEIRPNLILDSLVKLPDFLSNKQGA